MDFIHDLAVIEEGASIGRETHVWDFALVRKNASVGENCMIGRNVFVDHDVVIGDSSRIQNNALLYFPSEIGRNVFIGPSVVLTNDHFPRVSNTMSSKMNRPFEFSKVVVGDGASIGAGAVCVAPVNIGSHVLIGAGSVVVDDCVPFGLYFGTPARQVGWVCVCGQRLDAIIDEKTFSCLTCNFTYEVFFGNELRLLHDQNE